MAKHECHHCAFDGEVFEHGLHAFDLVGLVGHANLSEHRALLMRDGTHQVHPRLFALGTASNGFSVEGEPLALKRNVLEKPRLYAGV